MTYYFDVDGVIADFVRGICERFGVADPYLAGYQGWEFVEHLGLGREMRGLDVGFWADLHETGEARDIVRAVLERSDDVVVATTPMPQCFEPCIVGKMAWLRWHFPELSEVIMVENKWRLAGPNAVLVDDSEQNCDRFAARGGRAVMVPRPWNRNRGKMVMPYVEGTL